MEIVEKLSNLRYRKVTYEELQQVEGFVEGFIEDSAQYIPIEPEVILSIESVELVKEPEQVNLDENPIGLNGLVYITLIDERDCNSVQVLGYYVKVP